MRCDEKSLKQAPGARRETTRFMLPISWLILSVLLLLVSCEPGPKPLTIAGGPSGGTYQGFAEALAETVTSLGSQQFKVEATGGSVSNLRSINRRQHDLGLVYAGDAYLGRIGELAGVQPATKNVRAVCRLYGAAAQLLVPANSRFHDPRQMLGARVAIGNPGSGTAIAAERYFTSIGMWQMIVPIYVGFKMGMDELQKGRVAALWLVVGAPNQSVSRWFTTYDLRLLPLVAAADQSSFWTDYPFYEPVTIAAATYPGQPAEVASFMDSTLLLAGLQVPETRIYQLLKQLFSASGRKRMQQLHPLGKEMTLANGLRGIHIPLHHGAEHFWKELGRFVPAR